MIELKRQNERGFTILELMVATTIFAVVLLVLTVGVIGFSHDYFSGVNRSNTQIVARSIMTDITKAIEYGQATPQFGSSGNTQILCVDNVQYLYAVGYEVVGVNDAANHRGKYGLVKRVPATSCGSSAPDITSGINFFNTATDKELLAKNMRISDLTVTSLGNNTFTVHVRVAYGDDDLFGIASGTNPASWNAIACKGMAGSQFCAVSDLTTTVQQRITK